MFNGCKAADLPLKAIVSNRHMLVLGLVSSFSVIQLAGVSVFFAPALLVSISPDYYWQSTY